MFSFKLTNWMTNSVDPDQMASSEAIWSGSTLFAKVGVVVNSRIRVNKHMLWASGFRDVIWKSWWYRCRLHRCRRRTTVCPISSLGALAQVSLKIFVQISLLSKIMLLYKSTDRILWPHFPGRKHLVNVWHEHNDIIICVYAICHFLFHNSNLTCQVMQTITIIPGGDVCLVTFMMFRWN